MLEELKEIVREAGKIALDYQAKAKVSLKEDDSIVTTGDLATSKFLEEKLSKWAPVLSEENYNNKLTKEKVVFVIDPIDGTQSYAKHQESWSVLVALLENGIPTIGIVFQPSTDKLYFSKKGEGSFLEHNGETKRLKVNDETKIAIISPNELENDAYKKVLENHNIESHNYYYGAGMKMVRIAEGDSDFYYSCSKKCSVWDLLAPLVILEEAGGFLNLPDNYRLGLDTPAVSVNFIAANKKITL